MALQMKLDQKLINPIKDVQFKKKQQKLVLNSFMK
jgi:hypothetical protein